jgi:Family of unknown function (DUF6510)
MSGHVDGNALAGLLSEVFRIEPTVARGRCASCGSIAALAEGMVYGGEQGLVLRCHACDAVLLVAVNLGDAMRLQLRGIGWLQFEVGDGTDVAAAAPVVG